MKKKWYKRKDFWASIGAALVAAGVITSTHLEKAGIIWEILFGG